MSEKTYILTESQIEQIKTETIDKFAEYIIAIIDDIGYVNRISINQVKDKLKSQN